MGESGGPYWQAASNDPTIYLLKRIYYHSVECLRELSGDKFYLLMKPIVLPASISASFIARKVLQLEGDDLAVNAQLVSFGHDYLSYGDQELQLYEKAVVKRTGHCLIQDGPPEACLHCRLAGSLECSSTNPQHEMIVKSCMTEGFRCCEWYMKIADKNIEQNDYGRKIRDFPANPLGVEQRLQLSREILTWYISFTTMAITDNFGSNELLDQMRYRMYSEGMRFYRRKEKSTVDGSGDKLQQAILDLFHTLATNPKKISEASELMVIDSCPFSGYPPYICQLIELFVKGMSLLDGQGKELIGLERMTEGRSQCRYVLRDMSSNDIKWSDL
jgi:hypothetical protein